MKEEELLSAMELVVIDGIVEIVETSEVEEERAEIGVLLVMRVKDVSVSDEEISVIITDEIDLKVDQVVSEQSLSVHSPCIELALTVEELVYVGINWLLVYGTVVAMVERVQMSFEHTSVVIVVVLKNSSVMLLSLVEVSGHQVVYTVRIPLTVVETIEGCKPD